MYVEEPEQRGTASVAAGVGEELRSEDAAPRLTGEAATREGGTDEVRGLVWWDPEEDLLDELVHHRRSSEGGTAAAAAPCYARSWLCASVLLAAVPCYASWR